MFNFTTIKNEYDHKGRLKTTEKVVALKNDNELFVSLHKNEELIGTTSITIDNNDFDFEKSIELAVEQIENQKLRFKQYCKVVISTDNKKMHSIPNTRKEKYLLDNNVNKTTLIEYSHCFPMVFESFNIDSAALTKKRYTLLKFDENEDIAFIASVDMKESPRYFIVPLSVLEPVDE